MTDAPRITDEEFDKFVEDTDDYSGRLCSCDGCKSKIKQALAAFLKARVPDAKTDDGHRCCNMMLADGFNACRDAVLRGDKT